MKKIVFLVGILILIFLTACSGKGETTRMKPVWTEGDGGNTPLGQQITGVVEEKVYKKPKIHSVNMRVVGDIMTHKWQLWAAHDQTSNTYDFSEQFKLIKPFLQESDITIGNLETTFGGEELGFSGYPRFNTPDSLANSLQEVGFDLLTTANNHSLDTNSKGAFRTLDVLDQVGIEHIGTYRTKKESEQIKIKEVNNISFAFLSYTYGTNGIPIPKEHPYMINLIDSDKMKNDIKKAESLDPDFIVVSLHFGEEYQKDPNQSQRELVDDLFQAGADIILGGHPHVVQPMETRKILRPDGTEDTGFVIYSLGNFISSQRTPLDPPRDAGIILNLDFEKVENQKAELKLVSIMPTWVEFRNKNGKRVIRVLGDHLDENIRLELTQQEMNRFKNTREYTLSHILGESKPKKASNFFIYPFSSIDESH